MLTYDLTSQADAPLYEQLYRHIAQDIRQGRIAANEKLPSKRALAKHLGVSIITAEGAFDQLIAEGYVRAEQRKGYFACALELPTLKAPAPTPAAPTPAALATSPASPASPLPAATPAPASTTTQPAPLVADLRGGMAKGLFPYDAWARSLREALAREPEEVLTGEPDVQGTLRLRQVLCSYLREFRGIEATPDQIFIGAGAQYLYGMIVHLLNPNLQVAVEDPGYPRLTRIYQVNNVPLSHIPMDDQGISMKALAQSPANMVHITPSHQFPTGLVTSVSRRYELLSWAAQDPRRIIVEDDYDCEFRLSGRPIAPLASLDTQGQVIYTNTFTKSLGPAFRIGYVVLPPQLAQKYVAELGFYSCSVSAVDQLALSRFIESGSYERHVNRLRTHYRTLRNNLIGALQASQLGNRLAFKAQDSGIHFLMGIESDASDAQLAQRALAQGVAITPLDAFRSAQKTSDAATTSRRWFVVSYAGLEPNRVEDCVRALEAAW